MQLFHDMLLAKSAHYLFRSITGVQTRHGEHLCLCSIKQYGTRLGNGLVVAAVQYGICHYGFHSKH